MRQDRRAVPRFRNTSPYLAAIALFALAACEAPPGYDLRRVRFQSRPEATLEAAGVARPGVKLGPHDTALATGLKELTPGRISLSLAPTGDVVDGGQVDVELRETGWRSTIGLGIDEKCTLRWGDPGVPLDAPWQTCSFELSRPVSEAQLLLRRSPGNTGDVLVSELRIQGQLHNTRPNVFVLLLDAARFDMLRPFREGAPIGNNLEALARDSVTLTQLHSSSSWTRPAVSTLFTGLRADRHRVQERGDVLDHGAVTLAERLRDLGYSTTGWSTNPNVLPVWGMAQGFDVFMDLGGEVWASAKTDGSAVLSRLHAALSTRGPEAAFYYLHLMDPHGPYQPSKQLREAVHAMPGIASLFPRPTAIAGAPLDWAAFVDYLGELLDTDNHVGTFVQMLKDKGLYDDSLIVVLADHGEEFLDHLGRDHGRTLYEEVLHIPALVKLPGNRFAGTVFPNPSSLEDMLPTMLAALGVDVPADVDGRVLPLGGNAEFENRPHVATLRLDGFRQVTILDPPWKLILDDGRDRKELYDLAADPAERSDQMLSQPEVAQRLTRELDLLLSHGQAGWHILLCGALDKSPLDIDVITDGGSPDWFGFDDGEATLEPGKPGFWHLHPALVPRSVQQAVFGRLTTAVLPDHAEMLVPPNASGKSGVDIRSPGNALFDYRLGASEEVHTVRRLTLDSTSENVVAPATGARIVCNPSTKPGEPPAAPKRPFLRVWYEAPVQSVATENLDPALRERLRALGYLQ